MNRAPSLILFLTMSSALAAAQAVLKVSPPVWAALSESERDLVQQKYLVEVARPESYGVIVDTQGVDQSTPATTAGASLGGAVGGAAYIDRSFNNFSYSAKSHLGAVLLGSVLGSTLDRPAIVQYQFRYAVKFADGNIQYFDVTDSSAFRHPAGVCVMLPEVSLASDQGLCSHSVGDFRKKYMARSTEADERRAEPSAMHQAGLVICRIGAVAPVRTTPEKCSAVGGSVVNE